ncbi:molybdopterin-dependent oxidoreductase [Nocardia seriolae]|uniref:Sulfite oxidase n=1 Tax=Nocardia seriolae TaxID=37332 RepID=A0ABC8API2_9NOCA|nr:molybdopterin-dependent oxidoreductase [Nocardia seriolae]APA96067.1 Sulfite oxidase [Nocardia seriolae]WKY53735.1 molybdopterin-dependent oxidoreductase [Nocardia seriolae]WNJ60476.1 molybdopterin-dependent oxidoreductase [Nocardia seriolae]BAW09562.1 oxidoreductase [Nocardia seriolae]BEK85554.1 molybdopterin-dependent oxidoreductase [Nocardia seriolae]
MADRGTRIAGGIVAGGVTLGVAELVSVLVSPDSTPLQAVGGWIVDHTPDGFREWVIGLVGTNDKLLLFVSMGVAAVVLAGVAGVIERVGRPFGSVLFAAFGLLSTIAALGRPNASWIWALPSLIGMVAGILMLRSLIEKITALDEVAAEHMAVERRQVLRGIGIAGAAALVAGVAGRVIGLRSRDVSAERADVVLPSPSGVEPSVEPGADLRIPGLTPYLTKNADFYRIDTALTVPQVSKDDWSLRIHGMVDREIRLSYADLAAKPPIERLVTLTCVSNPVGGDLIGNARWLGYRLDELIAAAGPHPDADMVLSRSIDGFTAGSPLAVLVDGRDAMLAVGMNGEPLPTAHGYPARLVVPGLYGYVSATKWVTELEITRFDRAEAFWTKRGWSAKGPIKTECRIDTPRAHGTFGAGRITVAGVAWAQHRGIKGVEVRVDQGDWQPARLAVAPSIDTWVQWAFDWDATGTGIHTIWARATDGTGETQTDKQADVVPDGATGYPSLTVRIS